MAPRGTTLGLSFVFVAAGFLFSIGSLTLAVPSWLAAHGYGSLGVFTLTEEDGCSRYPPPQQRCGWFGDFVSDDHRVEKQHVELEGGLSSGAKLGDTVRARAAWSQKSVFRDGDTTSWRFNAMLLGISSGILLIGSISSITLYRVYRTNIADEQ